MTTLHLTMQGKGGVGKSVVSWILAQHAKSSGETLACFDTDPVNPSFSGYKAIGAERLSLGDDPTVIDPRSFDALMEKIIQADTGTTFVVDTGSPTFLPLLSYLAENDALEILEDAGCQVYLHSVLVAGSEMEECVRGLLNLTKTFPGAAIVVWLNEIYGPVEPGGTAFEDSNVMNVIGDKIVAVLKISERRKETFGHDLATTLKKRLTIAEALQSDDFNIMAKQRLKQIWRDLETQLANIPEQDADTEDADTEEDSSVEGDSAEGEAAE